MRIKKKKKLNDHFTEGIPRIGLSTRIDTEKIKEMYQESPHIEWNKFTESQGWPSNLRNRIPVGSWVDEKKQKVSGERNVEIRELVFQRKHAWHVEVLKTLKAQPEQADRVMMLLEYRLRQYAELIQHDQGKEKKERLFDKVATEELGSLVYAMKAAQEMKRDSLLLRNWSISEAKEQSDDRNIVEGKHEDDDSKIVINIVGGQYEAKQLQKQIDSWLDKPVQTVFSDAEVSTPPQDIVGNAIEVK